MLRGLFLRRGFALVLPGLMLAGCAYFNTFYSARQNYARGQKIERESKTDRLSPEAVKFYEKAIEKSAKVIVEYGGGWRAGVDDALFLMGACYYGKRDYETAIGKFNELARNYPNSKHVSEALFYTGLCYHRLREYEMGDQIFADLLRQHPGFARRDEMLSISGQGRETERDPAGALRFYGRLINEFPKSLERERALQRIGALQLDAGGFDSALVAYQTLARDTRSDETYFDAELNVGACLVRLARYDEALEIYRRVRPTGTDRGDASGRVWLAMADAENRAGRHGEALAHLELVIKGFENQTLAIEALYTKGYTFEVYLEDFTQARQAYQEAQSVRMTSVFKEQAARRLENLARVQELAAADTARDVNAEKLADAALKVAEFSLLDGDDPVRALKEYRAVVTQFPDTRAALRADFASAWILSRDLDSVETAGRILYDLADRHPGSPQAKGAVDLLLELGVDSARIAGLRQKVEIAQAAAAETTRAEPVARDTIPAPSPPELGAPADSLEHAPLSGPRPPGYGRDARMERMAFFDTLPPEPPPDSLPPLAPPEGP